jgi:hypothetical protein
MRSIISFKLDDDFILPKLASNDELFFPQASHLTYIHVTLWHFDDCILLLNQIGSQLHSFAVSLVYTSLRKNDTISRMRSVNISFQFDISMN